MSLNYLVHQDHKLLRTWLYNANFQVCLVTDVYGYMSYALLSTAALWKVKPGTCLLALLIFGFALYGAIAKTDLFVDVKWLTLLCFYAAFDKCWTNRQTKQSS